MHPLPIPELPRARAPFTVAVIDDHAGNRAWLAGLVERGGFRSHVPAPDEDTAKTLKHADILLLVDGGQAHHIDHVRRFKTAHEQGWIPVLFVTIGGAETRLLEALAAGADDCLVKPFNPAMLQAKLVSLARALAFQRDLDDLRRRSDAITENIIDGVVMIDANGVIQSCNGATLRIFGYSREELIGEKVERLMPEPYRSAHQGYIRAYLSGRPPRIIGVGQRQLLGQRRDGEIFPLELGVGEIHLDGQRYFLGILRDVSARVEAEARLRENARRLQEYHDAQEEENALGRDIIRRQMRLDAIEDPRVHTWLKPATAFSGDMLCVSHGPDGALYALLADATGHGLAAAITGLPLLTLFHRMARRGEPMPRMVAEINNELHATLPTGRFVAATLLRIDRGWSRVELWPGGMPDALLLDAGGTVAARLRSRELPLGVLRIQESGVMTLEFDIQPGQQIVLYSDGLTDARNGEGEAFGVERIETVLCQAPAEYRMQAIQHAFFHFMQGHDAEDDISLLLIDCAPQDTPAADAAQHRNRGAQ